MIKFLDILVVYINSTKLPITKKFITKVDMVKNCNIRTHSTYVELQIVKVYSVVPITSVNY